MCEVERLNVFRLLVEVGFGLCVCGGGVGRMDEGPGTVSAILLPPFESRPTEPNNPTQEVADGLCVLSPDEHATVLFTNASFSDYLRIPPQAVLGRCVVL